MPDSPVEQLAIPEFPPDLLGVSEEDALDSYEGAESTNAVFKPLTGEADAAPASTRLSRVVLENFKGFEFLDLRLGEFNLLVGANNSGKSTILQAIKLGHLLVRQHFPYADSANSNKGRTFPTSLLPVAEPRDLWYRNKWRQKNTPVDCKILLTYSGDLEFAFRLRLLYGAVNSQVISSPALLQLEDLQRVRGVAPVLVPSSFGVVSHEERRTSARVSNLIQTGRQNEAVRNMLHDLQTTTADRFTILQSLLWQHFKVNLQESLFDPDRDQFVDSRYVENGADLDLFSAGAGLVQVLQLLTFALHGSHGLVMLDEPDAHLHSSMQLIVIDMLEKLSRDFGFQVLISTHSKEIINFVPPAWLIPVGDGGVVAPLEPHNSALAVLEELGSIDNIDLYSLFTSRRCCFVEGTSDQRLLLRVASKVDSTVYEGDSRVVVIRTDGIDNFAPGAALKLFSDLAGVKLAHLSVRDRDGSPEERVAEMIAKADGPLIVHERDCIESYLVIPGAFARLAARSYEQKGVTTSAPTEGEMHDLVMECCDGLRIVAEDHLANALDEWYSKKFRQFKTPAELNPEARAIIDAGWGNLDEMLKYVPGKKLLARCRDEVQARYKFSMPDTAIIDAATAEELAHLIRIVRESEALAG